MASLTFPAHSGCTTPCCAIAGYWRLQAPTAKPPPPAWRRILEACGYQPGFVIGGVPGNFDVSARLGGSPFFVIEADEYDCAFFDKRSKFVHYSPRTLIMNNTEFDHADIFDDLKAIQKQFHHGARGAGQRQDHPAGQRQPPEAGDGDGLLERAGAGGEEGTGVHRS